MDLAVLLRRWGRLVKAAAKKLGAKVDSVFNLDRILRAPGTYNCKAATNGHGSIPVVCYADSGVPLTLAEVGQRLDRAGTGEQDPIQQIDEHEQFSRACLVNRVRKAPEGRRNNTLFGAAKDAARQGDLDGDMIAELTSAALESGLGTSEIDATIQSAGAI